MREMIRVGAVEGRMCPFEGARPGYVGYRVAKDGEDAEHSIPARLKGKPAPIHLVRIVGGVEVPNTVFYRRALDCGDIVRVEAVKAAKHPAPSASSEDKS